ncbi:MAG: Hpt domain-containing protein [Rhodospirillaceae bacterium]
MATLPRRIATPQSGAWNEPGDPLGQAEAAVAALADSFVDWVARDIGRAKDALGRARTAGADNRAELRAIFDVMHDVKGQGGTFGYELLTRLGASLCDYVRDAAVTADPTQLDVIAAHFAAMDFVLEKKLRGEGGEAGRRILEKIGRLVAHVPAPASSER